MTKKLLVVRAQDYLDNVSREPFVGLPREEIERLRDAIGVLAVERLEPGELQLAAYAALHHNYAWLTGLDGPGTIGKNVLLHAEGQAPAFLDESLDALARRQLQAAGLPDVPYESRLAGLMNEGQQLRLVYVVRLHQRWDEIASLQIRGNTELRFSRDDYDAASQLLIQHLHAF